MKMIKHWFLYCSLIFSLALLVFSFWGSKAVFPDPDAFYHAGMARLIAEKGIVKDFPWLQFTTLKDHYVDQHFLFHVLLIPGVILGGLWGVKITNIILASLFVTIFAVVLKKLGVRFFWLWSIFLIFTVPFTFRLNLVKANSLSLLFLFLGIYFVEKKAYKSLFFAAFLYVWTYGGFPLLLLVSRRIKSFFVILAGLLGGLIINPYFPQNLKFYWQQLVQIGVINYQDKIGVGGEWYAYGASNLFSGSIILSVFLIISLGLFFYYFQKENSLSFWSFLWFVFFLVLTLKSRRYVEYYAPFAWFFVAITLERVKSFPAKAFFMKFLNNGFGGKLFTFSFLVYFLFIISAILLKDWQINKNDLESGFSFNKFAAAGQWMKANILRETIVFHSDWDEFPLLFWHNPNNFYIVGLDPTFMYNADQNKYWQFVNITIGKTSEDLKNIISQDFQADYVFLEKDHHLMDRNLKKNDFSLIYEDEEVKIYQ